MNSVSVVIPAYRADKYIKRCLDSIAAQTVLPDEIVVVVDGCERTFGAMNACVPAVLGEIVRAVWLPENLGAEAIGRVYNIGIVCARGDAVMCFDVDDEMMSHYIESMMDIINDGDVAVARQIVWEGNEIKNKSFVCSNLAARRSVFLSAGGYEPWPCEEDSEFVQRLRQIGHIVRAPEANNMIRHKEPGSITMSDNTGMGTETQKRYYHLRECRKSKPVIPNDIAIGRFREIQLSEGKCDELLLG